MAKIILTIPAVGPSANTVYAGMHPMARRKLAHQWHTLILVLVQDQKIGAWSGPYPVDISVRCEFGRRMYDSDNLYTTGKLAIDGLVRAGILENDSPNYVRSVTFTPARSNNGRNQTIITIQEAKNA